MATLKLLSFHYGPSNAEMLKVLETTNEPSSFATKSGTELLNSSFDNEAEVTICASFLSYRFNQSKHSNQDVLDLDSILFGSSLINFIATDFKVFGHFTLKLLLTLTALRCGL